MLERIGFSGIFLLLLIALLLFGPNKLPELGRALGRTLREFKAGANDMINNEEEVKSDDTNKLNSLNRSSDANQKGDLPE